VSAERELLFESVKNYFNNFKPNFKILPIPTDSVRKITRGYPLFLKLKTGKIEKVMKDV